MTVGITGASGALGRATAEYLLQTVDPAGVVLTTRRPETLDDFAARGVQIRRADFTDADTLPAAFAGVDKLLLISTDDVGARVEQHRAAIAAAASVGVGHIAYTSIPRPVAGNPALVVPSHAATEQTLRDSGLAWTMLRNNLYTHMQVPTVERAAQTGQLISNRGAGAGAYVTREDCAAVAAAVLAQDGHEGKTYDVTGPEAIGAADLVELAGRLAGRPIELVAVDDAAFAEGLGRSGLPPAVAALVTSFGTSVRAGYLTEVSSTVIDLTGRRPTSLSDVLTATARA